MQPDVFGNLATTQHTEVKCTCKCVSVPWSPEAELATGCPALNRLHIGCHTLCGSGGWKVPGDTDSGQDLPRTRVESASAEVICYNQVCLSAQSPVSSMSSLALTLEHPHPSRGIVLQQQQMCSCVATEFLSNILRGLVRATENQKLQFTGNVVRRWAGGIMSL